MLFFQVEQAVQKILEAGIGLFTNMYCKWMNTKLNTFAHAKKTTVILNSVLKSHKKKLCKQ